jgi:hypothetical protein
MAISRFQVMAILQAARAKTLGLREYSAYSWGLNRAIFYAAAKRGFKGGGSSSRRGRGTEREETTGESRSGENKEEFFLGNEKAFVDKESSKKNEPVFEIGSEAQTASDFQKQIASRFGDQANFQEAWKEALKIMKGHDESTLKSQHEFYERVYKPRRDVLSKKWSDQFTTKKVPAAARA